MEYQLDKTYQLFIDDFSGGWFTMQNENVEAHILGHRLYLIRGADDNTDYYKM